MQLTRYNTDLGSDALPSYLPTAAELAIMAIPGRGGQRVSRWLEARTDRGLQLTSAGAFRFWVDRARGVKYVPAGPGVPAVTGAAAYKRVTFDRFTLLQALVAEDASDAFTDAEIYTIALVTRQTPQNNGGAPIGNGAAAAADLTYPWMNPGVGGAMNYFSRGTASNVLNNGITQNDGTFHVNLISIDTTQATAANRSQMRRDGVILSDNTGVPAALASSAGARRMMIGGAGRAASIDTFYGSVGAVILLPGIALHLPANAEYLALVESYLTALAASL